MSLKVTFTRGDGVVAHLALTVGAEALVGDVAEHLHQVDPTRLGQKAPKGVTLVVTPLSAGPKAPARPLERDLDFASSGVRSGDHLEISNAASASRTSGAPVVVATAAVVAGPDRGKTFDLPPGSSIIGRDADVAVRLSDSLASKRHARITIGDEIEIVDMGSTNGVIIGDAFITRSKILPGDTVVIGDTEIEITRAAVQEVVVPTTSTVSHTRSPRVVPPLPSKEVQLPDPPAKPSPRRFPGIALAAPIVMGVTLFLVTGRVMSLIFVVISPLMMIGSFFDAKHVQKRELREKGREFDENLAATRRELGVLQDAEREIRLKRTPSVEDVAEAVKHYGRLLWTHRPEHQVFLAIRLGLGSVPSCVTIESPKRGESYPDFWERLLETQREFAEIEGVPVLADLRSAGNLGIAGDPAVARGVARSIVAQIAGLHSPAECVITAFTSPASREDWRWMSWLPHTTSSLSPIQGDHLSDSRGGSANLLASLEAIVAGRTGVDIGSFVPEGRGPEEAEADSAKGEDQPLPTLPAIIVLVEDDAFADRSRLIRLAEKGPDVNVHLVWIAPSIEHVPAASRTFLEVGDPEAGVAGVVRRGLSHHPLACETLDIAEATDLARRLSCVEDVGAVGDVATDIPRMVSYVDLHGQDSVEPGTYEQQWKVDATPGKKRPFTLRALVGHAGNEPAYLDLRSQGPHALVGGTTGAGKSEFLQSWILGMAAAYGPDKVTFLFVDYKGGSAFADCVNLPHSVGLVTDLTPHLVDRALTSLRAELHFRERLLQAKKAKDLETLEKSGDPDTPPSLVIVIDEFAALVQEVPDFVDGVVDIAQRGRSLGLHLIMATQRPTGVIKDNLRANTNLRIALRMADAADSVDILDVASAAHIDPSLPGRAIARTGPGRMVTFHSAYVGGHTSAEQGRPTVDVVEFAMGSVGPWELPRVGAPAKADDEQTDAERVVTAMRAATKLASIPAPRRPWLDELQTTYELRHIAKHRGEKVPLGIVDDPAHQQQEPLYFSPDQDGNIAVFGTSGTGKSTALRTLAIGATLSKDVAPVHIYAIDAAGGGLAILRALPNVAGVIDVDDSERVGRLIRRLDAMIDERAVKYSELRASNLTEYRKLSGDRGHPRVFLLLDGFGSFQEEYQTDPLRVPVYVAFQSIISKGRAVGVHVALSADRQGALHSSIQAQLSRSIVFRLADENQYAMFGVNKSILTKDSPAGRGIDVATDREIQVAVFGGSSSVVAQSAAIDQLVESFPDRKEWIAPEIPAMPTEVHGVKMPPDVDGKPVLGIESESLEPMGFALGRPFMVAGQPGSGRTTALRWLHEAIARSNPKTKQILLSLRPTSVAGGKKWAAVAQSGAEAAALLDKYAGKFEEPAKPGEGWVVVIEAIGDFVGSNAEQALLQALKTLKRGGHTVIAEAETTGWTSGMLISEVKSARRGLILQPEYADGPMLFGVSFPRQARSSMPPGRGILVESGRPSIVQVPLPDGENSP